MAEHFGMTRAILAILQPPLPDFQHKLPRSGPVAWAIRLFLVWYTVLTTLLVVLLLLLAPNTLPQHPEWKKLSPVRRFARAFAIYTISNFIWAITSYGSPPKVDRFKIPWLSQKVFSRDWRQSWRKGQLHTHLQLVPPLRKVHRFGIVSQVIPPAQTPCFWLSRTTPDPLHDKHVFLYLVGGGYVIGTPLLGSFAYSLVHATSHPVFAPDYTKALSLETSFPGPLCEALAAYQSLRDQGWSSKQIVVIGDSAGGGLAWSLLVYLAALRSELGVPQQVIMISVSQYE
jgi:acetyl esterase/lipase